MMGIKELIWKVTQNQRSNRTGLMCFQMYPQSVLKTKEGERVLVTMFFLFYINAKLMFYSTV